MSGYCRIELLQTVRSRDELKGGEMDEGALWMNSFCKRSVAIAEGHVFAKFEVKRVK